MNVLGLVQLCEVAQPSGGYSHSFHVEQLAQRGRLTTAEQLLHFLQNVLHVAIAPADGIASGIAFRAARSGEFEHIPTVCNAMSSGVLPAEMRLASLQMGQRLWALSRNWDWASAVHSQLDPLAADADLHHAVAFGTLVSEATNSQVRAIAAYLFNTARNIVLTAIRVIPLEERLGHRVLSEVQPVIAELAQKCVDKQPSDILSFPPPSDCDDPLGRLLQ